MMKMYNNPFFTAVPGIGDLDLEEVIVEDTCPIFFTCISKDNQRYVVTCCEVYEEQRWIISPISNFDLIRLLTNKLSMRQAFLTQSREDCVIAHWSKDRPTLGYEKVTIRELPEQDLPFDEMLDADADEFEAYIQKLAG